METFKEMKADFEWVRKVISSENNRCIHYDSLKRLINNFAKKWKPKSSYHPDLYFQYVNYLTLKLKFEYSDE